MASTASNLSVSLYAKQATTSSIPKPINSFPRNYIPPLQNPKFVSTQSLFFSSKNSVELNRRWVSVSNSGGGRSSRICASSAQVMDQFATKTEPGVPTIVEVDLGNRSYPIYIGSGLLDKPELLQR